MIDPGSAGDVCVMFFHILFGHAAQSLQVTALTPDGSRKTVFTTSTQHGLLWEKGHATYQPDGIFQVLLSFFYKIIVKLIFDSVMKIDS